MGIRIGIGSLKIGQGSTGVDWSSYWKTRGKLVLTFDDGKSGIYTDAFPILVAKGITATFYIVTDYVGTAGYVTWAQLVEMQAAGMDIQCHTKDHVNLTTLTEEQVNTNLLAVNAAFVANGLIAPSHISYPGGQYNHDVKTYVSDHRLTGRRTGYGEITGDMDKYGIPSQWVDNGYLNVTTMTTIKGYIDTANTNKTALCLYAHDCSVAGGELAISGANLNEIIDYAQGVPVDIMSISQLYAQMSHALIVDVDTPVTFTLTSAGNGIAKLLIVATSDLDITIDGSGRFYTDEAATLNESISREVLSGVQATIYIKCTSGVSNMVFSKDVVERFTYMGQTANYPTIGGDIKSFPYLIYLYVTGNSTMILDLNEMSRLLQTVEWRSGTAIGSISQIPYNTTTLKIPVGTGISGNVGILREGFLILEAGTNNTITGTISSLPSTLTYLQVTGNCTLSGDMADAPAGITRFDVYGQNRINTYTAGKTWNNNINYVRNMPAIGYGLDVTELTNLIIDLNNSAWAGSGRQLYVSGNNASMADINQGGIWGDFDGETTPSALATAYKSLMRTKSVTVTLTGITVPGGSGDGTGFPAGFGDWYRS